MEENITTVSNSESEKSSPNNKKQQSDRGKFSIIISMALIAFFAGIGGAMTYNHFASNNKEIVVLDINKVVSEKRDFFLNKYKDKEPSEETKQAMQKDIALFSSNLTTLIERESKKNVILLKDSVISENVRDITENARKQLLTPSN